MSVDVGMPPFRRQTFQQAHESNQMRVFIQVEPTVRRAARPADHFSEDIKGHWLPEFLGQQASQFLEQFSRGEGVAGRLDDIFVR